MLEGLDAVPWKKLKHAYGSAGDVPDLLRKLLDPDPKVRRDTLWTLNSNVLHQGTRYPATPYVVPFLIEMCASPEVGKRGDLLRFWGSLIAGDFSIQARPCWGDGKHIYLGRDILKARKNDKMAKALHDIYGESLQGHQLVCTLLTDQDQNIRSGAAWVLACLPTRAEASVPELTSQLGKEKSGSVRGAIAFALGELDASAPLQEVLTQDPFPAARCMAACELARIQPTEALAEHLLPFLSDPIDRYEKIPGAGGKSTGDAAFSVSQLSPEVQRRAIPAICDQLHRARSFDTIPLVVALLSAAFTRQEETVKKLTDLQKQVLGRMAKTQEMWSVGNFGEIFREYGLPHDRPICSTLSGVKQVKGNALEELERAFVHAELDFLEEARTEIDEALRAGSGCLRAPPQTGGMLAALRHGVRPNRS